MAAVKVAVLPSIGIGDALLMTIVSHQLSLAGCDVTTFHAKLPELSSWFPNKHFSRMPSEDVMIQVLSSFDRIIIENDNSGLIPLLRSAFTTKDKTKLCVFFVSYSLAKHGPLSPFDQVFLPHLSMVANIERAISQLIPLPISTNNGITAPSHLAYKRHPYRVVIHPTSRHLKKNWSPKRFMTLAGHLKRKGFIPIFSVSPQERKEWLMLQEQGFDVPELPSLSALAELIYESGYAIGNDSVVGHLASNLNIPTVIIANDPKRMRLWKPGWHPGKLVFPPPWIPNFKGMRLREEKWQHFISVSSVLKAFDALVTQEV